MLNKRNKAEKQEAQLPQRERASDSALSYVQKAFRYVKIVQTRITTVTDRETAGRTDRLKPYGAESPISIKSERRLSFRR